MRAFVVSRLPASTPQRAPGLSTERGSAAREVGRARHHRGMTLDLALAILDDARAALTDPAADPRSALLAARVELRAADQALVDLMNGQAEAA